MKTPIFILLFLFRIQVSAQPLTSDIKKEIITQINEFRKVTGDSPGQTLNITRNANLDKAAQFHSDWLANSGLALANVNHHIETKSVNGQPKLVNCWDRGKYFKVAVFADGDDATKAKKDGRTIRKQGKRYYRYETTISKSIFGSFRKKNA